MIDQSTSGSFDHRPDCANVISKFKSTGKMIIPKGVIFVLDNGQHVELKKISYTHVDDIENATSDISCDVYVQIIIQYEIEDEDRISRGSVKYATEYIRDDYMLRGEVDHRFTLLDFKISECLDLAMRKGYVPKIKIKENEFIVVRWCKRKFPNYFPYSSPFLTFDYFSTLYVNDVVVTPSIPHFNTITAAAFYSFVNFGYRTEIYDIIDLKLTGDVLGFNLLEEIQLMPESLRKPLSEMAFIIDKFNCESDLAASGIKFVVEFHSRFIDLDAKLLEFIVEFQGGIDHVDLGGILLKVFHIVGDDSDRCQIISYTLLVEFIFEVSLARPNGNLSLLFQEVPSLWLKQNALAVAIRWLSSDDDSKNKRGEDLMEFVQSLPDLEA